MSKPIQLQSGFIGVDGPNMVFSDKLSTEETINRTMRHQPVLKGNPFSYHAGMANIWKEYSADHTLMRSMEFRERFLLVLKDCFNGISFTRWCDLQHTGKYITGLHKRFLNETLGYLAGDNRAVRIESWATLLDLRIANDKDVKVELNTRPFFVNRRYYDNANLGDLVNEWSAHEDGFTDLIWWANVVFGADDVVVRTRDLDV